MGIVPTFPMLKAGALGLFGAKITNALRLNDNDSAELTRTPGANNRTTWTYSTWIKRCNLGNNQGLFAAGINTDNETRSHFRTDGGLRIIHRDAAATTTVLDTTPVYRDPSAWLHTVFVWDTGNSTADDRHRIYVNGDPVTDFNTRINPGLNKESDVNAALAHFIGDTAGGGENLDAYLAETVFVDGQALGPENFGEFNPTTGVWVPKTYTGTYGTNGFRLDYGDSGTLGNDVSGNNNDFTSSGLAPNDQVPDTPTNNHCTLNSVRPSPGTLANGNLDVSGTVNAQGTFGVSSGAFAWEVTLASGGAAGIEDQDGAENTYTGSTSDVIQFRLDMDAGTCDRNVNGGGWVSLATGLTGTQFPLVKIACTVDFGQHGYSPPTGYKTLTAPNLPAPTILDPSAYFQPHIYTGTGSAHSETLTGNSDLQPDLVWIKNRDQADEHKLVDAVRGVTKELSSDSSNLESTDANGVTALNSDGFTLGTGANGYNDNAEKFVAWCWKEGAIPGFDIVSYIGTGANRTISHSLGAAPDLIIPKDRSAAGNWAVYHSGNTPAPETDNLVLDLDLATNDNIAIWNDTAPTSSVFSLGTSTAVNDNGETFIAYLWAEVEGFSKFGAYEGNGNADGPFVWCGFRPALVLCKSIDSTSAWHLYDNQREGYNADNDRLAADVPTAEGTADEIDLLSNGFKLRVATDPNVAETYIFMAFAESPFKYARAR